MIDQPRIALAGSHTVQMPQLGAGFWEISDEIAPRIVETALDLGYRRIDTAKSYGNEIGVGRGIASSGVPRDEIFLTTKLWNPDQGDKATRAALKASLGRLHLDYVDLYLIHWPTPDRELYFETWHAMRELRDEGLTRQIGVCNLGPRELRMICAQFGEYPALNQIELHPYLAQREARRFHRENGIATESWSPLASQLNLLRDPLVSRIAGEIGCTAAQVVCRWNLEMGNALIPRSSSPVHLAENLGAIGVELSQGDIVSISSLDRGGRMGPDPAKYTVNWQLESP